MVSQLLYAFAGATGLAFAQMDMSDSHESYEVKFIRLTVGAVISVVGFGLAGAVLGRNIE